MRNPLIRKASEIFDTEIIGMLEPPAIDESDPQATSVSEG
jgi:hypothetical protein